MVKPRLRAYLQEVGVHRWSRAHSEGHRYNIMTMNISEYLNVVLVKEWELLVIALTDEMRSIIKQFFYYLPFRCALIFSNKTKFTPEAEKALTEQYQLSLHMHNYFKDICNVCELYKQGSQYIFLDPAFDAYYTIFDDDKNGIVDLEARTCSCKRFQLDHLPCAHAMIAIRHLRGDVYEYCSDYHSLKHWKSTYAGVFYPLPHQSDWVVPDNVREIKVLSCYVRTVCGRQRKCRLLSTGETIHRHKCSRCGEHGHHHKTC
ncbi:hypothetical protein UlMin_012964 [Ulmus minor]